MVLTLACSTSNGETTLRVSRGLGRRSCRKLVDDELGDAGTWGFFISGSDGDSDDGRHKCQLPAARQSRGSVTLSRIELIPSITGPGRVASRRKEAASGILVLRGSPCVRGSGRGGAWAWGCCRAHTRLTAVTERPADNMTTECAGHSLKYDRQSCDLRISMWHLPAVIGVR